MFSFEEILEKIISQTGLSKEEIEGKIEEKQIELSNLISKEGAAHLVAKEMGIDLLKATKHVLEIKNMVPGMRNLDFTGRVYRIFEPISFEKNGNKGSVCNIILWDPSGTVRMSLWGDEIKILESLNIKQGDVVKIEGYTREDNRGESEVRLGRMGKITKLDVDFPSIEQNIEPRQQTIQDIKEGGSVKIRASIVQIFESNPFYAVCPKCGNRVREDGSRYFCDEHQWVDPSYKMVVSGVIDDGSGTLRVVFFGDVAEKIIGMSSGDALKMARDKMNKTAPIEAAIDNNLGKEFVFAGRVKRNKMFDRIEMIVGEIHDVNVEKEATELLVATENKIKGV